MSLNNLSIGIPPYYKDYDPKSGDEKDDTTPTLNTSSEPSPKENNQNPDKWDFEKENAWDIAFLDKKT